jgi:hypothetical protein
MATRQRRVPTNNQPDSPKPKRIQERAIQQQAFNELLVHRHANGGDLKYGSVQSDAG